MTGIKEEHKVESLITDQMEVGKMEGLITKEIVPRNERLGFMASHFGAHASEFQTLVFTLMERHCPPYSGGYWDFYKLSNGGIYISLDQEGDFKVSRASNYFCDEMTVDGASIAMNLEALNNFAWKYPSWEYGEMYHSLRDYAFGSGHGDAGKIAGFID